jgi:hypothetical protein
VFGYFGIDKLFSARLERGQSAFLVFAHETAVAGNVGREDGGQPSFDPRFGH